MGGLKEQRRIATRFEKRASRFLAMVIVVVRAAYFRMLERFSGSSSVDRESLANIPVSFIVHQPRKVKEENYGTNTAFPSDAATTNPHRFEASQAHASRAQRRERCRLWLFWVRFMVWSEESVVGFPLWSIDPPRTLAAATSPSH